MLASQGKHVTVFSKNVVDIYYSATVSREISMAMYFAQMNDETIGITPWPELLLAAVPYAIKWHQLAIHCLTVEVSQLV